MVDFKERLTEDNTEPNTLFLKQLRSKLPEFFTQDKYGVDDNGDDIVVETGGFDIQKFQDSLSNHNVNEIKDGYTLNFVGKNYAKLQAGTPTISAVIPDVKHNAESKNAKSENVFLTGDNLDVLKHLQQSYTNSIDVIYIDPPYNTGTDGFVYNDKFDLSDEYLRDTLNMSEDEIKKIHLLNGRSSHSAWLSFIYPRLKIAQQLLKDSGLIFVSIDDNEQANLKLLLDEIFGELNFVEEFINRSNPRGNQAKKYTASEHEYILAYAKNINQISKLGSIKKVEEFGKEDENGKYEELGLRKRGAGSRREDAPNQYYPIYFGVQDNSISIEKKPNYVEIIPKLSDGSDGRWRWSKAKVQVDVDKLMVRSVQRNGERVYDVFEKKYFTGNQIKKEKSIFYEKGVNNENATEELKSLFDGNKFFSFPKPTYTIKKLVSIGARKDAIILDFFAGSATTADAVMQLNAEDGGTRKWILNTLDEKTPGDSAAYNAGYLTIDEISRDRIKRAGEKIKKEYPEIERFDDGFKHYYVKEIDANTIDKIIDFDPNSIQILTDDVVSEFAGNAVRLGEYYEKSDKDKVNPKFAKIVDTGASGEDTILQTWLINDGYKFDVPVKTIELVHHNVHYVEDGAMAYIIDPFTQDDVEALLNLIGTQKLNVKTIIVFGYSFDFATMTSLKNNVKTVLDGVRVEVRY